jgi:FkbM family methyltransferase
MDLKRPFIVVIGVVLAIDAVLAGQAIWPRAQIVWGRHSSCRVSDMTWTPDRVHDQNESERLQKASRLVQTDANVQLVQTPRGSYWVPRGGMESLDFVLAELRDDPYFQGGVRVKTGDVVLDCGANVGVFTRRALDAGARLVVAIEHAPDSVAALRRTFAKEIAENKVIVYDRGVWDKQDFLDLAVSEEAPSGNSLVLKWFPASRKVRVPLTTIDLLVQDLKLERVDFIKMDIEGAEPNAVAGARETIRKFRPRMAITLEHRDTDVDRIPEMIHEIDPAIPWQYAPCLWVRSPILNRLQPQVAFFGE